MLQNCTSGPTRISVFRTTPIVSLDWIRNQPDGNGVTIARKLGLAYRMFPNFHLSMVEAVGVELPFLVGPIIYIAENLRSSAWNQMAHSLTKQHPEADPPNILFSSVDEGSTLDIFRHCKDQVTCNTDPIQAISLFPATPVYTTS